LTSIKELNNLLDVYTLTEIFEMNDLTEADVLRYLEEQEFIILPDPEPLDFE
jgi:hypothetical protein